MSDDTRPEVVRQYNDLGQLASGVGHHVINAYSSIVSNAELLKLLNQSSPGSIDPNAIAEVIIKTAVEASAVARRLIDHSRLATAFEPAPVSLDKLAASVIEEQREKGRRFIAWSLELNPVPVIRGSEEQLRDLLGHLVANAVEAMPASGGEIGLVTSTDDRGWAVLEVVDTGRGMSAQVQQRAVEPFFTTKPGHLGVGLSIANGIWRRHKGTLAVRSQAGEGTRVRLCVEPASPTKP